MQILACALLIGLGVASVVAAINPAIPGLRAMYWWSFLFKTRPIIIDRIFFALFGLFLIAIALYIFIFMLLEIAESQCDEALRQCVQPPNAA